MFATREQEEVVRWVKGVRPALLRLLLHRHVRSHRYHRQHGRRDLPDTTQHMTAIVSTVDVICQTQHSTWRPPSPPSPLWTWSTRYNTARDGHRHHRNHGGRDLPDTTQHMTATVTPVDVICQTQHSTWRPPSPVWTWSARYNTAHDSHRHHGGRDLPDTTQHMTAIVSTVSTVDVIW